MPLAYVLDEHLRGPLWRAVQRHNALGTEPLDALRVGDPSDLPLGTGDAELLLWAEKANRLLISFDEKSLAGHLASHLAAGNHCPGIFIPRRQGNIPTLLAFLVEAAYRSRPGEWQDRIEYIP